MPKGGGGDNPGWEGGTKDGFKASCLSGQADGPMTNLLVQELQVVSIFPFLATSNAAMNTLPHKTVRASLFMSSA